MPSELFLSLQRALDRIASAPIRGAAGASTGLSATLDGLTVVYELNDTDRILIVANILRAES